AAPLQAAETPSLLRRMRVKEVMTPDPITVSPDEPVEVAACLLREHKIGSLPVVEHRMLAGIVTQTDLFDALIHLLGGDIRGVRVSIDLPNGLADLTALAGVLTPLLEARSGALTLSVRIDATSRRGYVRVRTSAPLILAEQLAVAGLEVSHLRLDPPAKPTRALS
ncbi:MAG: CBS domain-containing protein, partial [Armatimonadetes bacterium]|nr:CBS domain-containing protein [Armatimonadota bacterium]